MAESLSLSAYKQPENTHPFCQCQSLAAHLSSWRIIFFVPGIAGVP
jgi:hypothetical protein